MSPSKVFLFHSEEKLRSWQWLHTLQDLPCSCHSLLLIRRLPLSLTTFTPAHWLVALLETCQRLVTSGFALAAPSVCRTLPLDGLQSSLLYLQVFCSKPSFLVRITLTPSWLLQLAPFPSLQHWHTNDPFSEISPLLNHLESYYPHSGTRPRKCSLKHTTYTSQTSHLASASLHVKIMHCYRIGTKTCFPACMEERKKKTVRRCRIGRRMRKECHFSELNTEKLQTTNICNFNHILRDQKTSKLQHPQNLQNATGARNGRKKNPPQKAQTQKQKT